MEKVNVAEEWAKLRIDLYLGVSLMPDYLSKFGGDLESESMGMGTISYVLDIAN